MPTPGKTASSLEQSQIGPKASTQPQGSEEDLRRSLATLDRALRVAAGTRLQQLALQAGPGASLSPPLLDSLLGQLHPQQQLPLLATLLQALGPELQTVGQEEGQEAGVGRSR
jgi:hypothetical protein